MKIIDNDIRKVQDLEDGSSIYEVGPIEYEEVNSSFEDNLAKTIISTESLKRISSFLLEKIAQDIEASKPWFDVINKAKKVLGFDIVDSSHTPFENATQTCDSTMATALVRAYSMIRSELLPALGPAGFILTGDSNEQLENKGRKISKLYNRYLTRVDKPYYPDFERFIFHFAFNGSGFKKIYRDQILKRPIIRFISCDDFIIDADCTSILESNRLTHVLKLSKRDILINQQQGLYRDVDLNFLNDDTPANDELETIEIHSEDKPDKSSNKPSSLFKIYECHVYLNLSEFGNSTDVDNEAIPLPYIVVLEPTSGEILSIRRNWLENDPNKNRINSFVQYNFLSGFGIRGLGLAHLLGSNAITLTTIERSLVDAGKFKNLQAGFLDGNGKQQEMNFTLGPGEYKPLQTGGIPLRDYIMQLPFDEPSQTLYNLWGAIGAQTRELGSNAELGMMESRDNIQTGTALALLERSNVIQSAALKSIHFSLGEELQLFDSLFRKSITMDYIENIGGEYITAADFVDEIQIVPAADPSTNSSMHRMIRAEAIKQAAMEFPEIHNMREVYTLYYKAHGIDENEIKRILVPEQTQPSEPPFDPKQALVIADIKQKEAETAARERIANMEAETDVFKAQLDFEKEKARIESAEDIAKMKAEIDLMKYEDKNGY